MRFLILFIFFCFNSFANEVSHIKNITINKELKKYDSLTFLDIEKQQLNLKDFEGNLILLNFWATWCAPCRKEMPSLDKLKGSKTFKNAEIIAVNIADETYEKSKKFFDDLKIKNLEVFLGSGSEIARKLKIRGLPTTILIDNEGYEFARIVGYIDFEDKSFLNWLDKNL